MPDFKINGLHFSIESPTSIIKFCKRNNINGKVYMVSTTRT